MNDGVKSPLIAANAMSNVTITCYPEMNDKIIELLQMCGDATSLYAAQRIEDLEKQLEDLESKWDDLEDALPCI